MRLSRARRFIGVLSLVAPTAIVAQAPKAPAVSSEKPLPVDTAYTIGTLPNGMRYYLRANQKPEKRAELRLVVNAGSVLEDDDQRGLAHLLEHMAFNGSKNFKKTELVAYLESIGMRFGGDLNASTSYEHTIYTLTIPTDAPGAFEKGLLILEDWAQGIALDQKAIEEERGIVLSERRSRLGAGTRIRAHTDSVMLGGSKYLDRDPIGTVSRLETARREELLRFYKDWYRPDLMAVVVVGDIDKQATEAMIRRQFGAIPAPKKKRTRPNISIPDNRAPLVSIVADPEQSGWGVQFMQKYRPSPVNSVARAREGLTEGLYTRILTQRLRDIARQSDAPFLSARPGVDEYLGGLNLHTIINVSTRENQLEHGLEAALTEVERIAQHGITDAEFDQERRSMIRQIEQALITRTATTSSAYASAAISNFLNGGALADLDADVERSKSILATITREEVAAVAKRWHSRQNLVLVATLPQKEGATVPTAAGLLGILDSVSRKQIAPYGTTVAETPLLETLPTPGSIVKERQIAGVGITEWTLSNGVRVLLKSTDFNPDQILMSGYGWGGMSLVADADLPSAMLANSLPATSGLGAHNSASLQKAIVGKLLSVGMKIDDVTQTVGGSTSVRDVETFLQFVYLHFTAPRVDTASVRAWQQRMRSAIEGRQALPESHFADSLSVVLTQGHPRTLPLTLAQIDAIDLDRALAIYRERYADANGFTFVFVGKIDPDSLRPLVTRYLGSLPSGNGKSGWRDNGVRAPGGVVEKTFRFGAEPRSRTAIIFDGPFNEDVLAQPRLNAMATVLQTRLRERLREELGATYNVGVQAVVHAIPERGYRVSIGFDAAPERADELTSVVFAEVEKLRKLGPTKEEVQKVREESIRQLELGWKNNGFWLQTIVGFSWMERPLEDIASYDEPFRQLKAEQIHAMAQKYLDASRHIRVTQLPAQ